MKKNAGVGTVKAHEREFAGFKLKPQAIDRDRVAHARNLRLASEQTGREREKKNNTYNRRRG